jgi:enoyl-CoA hydratase/carnithine racemase
MVKPVNRADIFLQSKGRIGELVLNMPLTHNAISRAMWRKITGLLGQAQDDSDLKVLIVHGGDQTSFSAGANIAQLTAMVDDAKAAEQFHHEMSIALHTLANFPKPVIARIHGPCIGAGLALAMACDVRIASASARFGVTPAKLGLTYPLSDTRALVALIGPARAKDLIFSARLVDAREARHMGLVEAIAPEATLVEFTRQYARQMAARSAHTQTHMKNQINALCEHDAALEANARAIFIESFSGADCKEGFAAFAQKRKPDFGGD